MPMYEATVQLQLTVRIEAEDSGQAEDLIFQFIEVELPEAGKAASTPVQVVPDVYDIIALEEMD